MADHLLCRSTVPFERYPAWCCQSNANQSPLFANEQVLGDEKIAPLAKGGVAFLFEADSRVDVPFEVEVIVH
jgi:hypothetical protein